MIKIWDLRLLILGGRIIWERIRGGRGVGSREHWAFRAKKKIGNLIFSIF